MAAGQGGSVVIDVNTTTYIYVLLESDFDEGSTFTAQLLQYPTLYFRSGTTTLINGSKRYHQIALTPDVTNRNSLSTSLSFSLIGDLIVTIADILIPPNQSPPVSIPVVITP